MKNQNRFRWISLAAIGLTLLSCTWSLIGLDFGNGSSTPVPVITTPTPFPAAEIIFELTLPAPIASGGTINLHILDEVTGLSLNPTIYVMQARDDLHYSVHVPLAMGSIVKYRYVRQGGTLALEDNAYDQSIRYRMAYVSGPNTIQDLLISWADQAFSGPVGSIAGTVISESDQRPVPNAMVSAGGMTTMTDSLGQYILEGLPPGTHNVIAYSIDGSTEPYSQGAVVAANATTAAPLAVQSVPTVQVTFNMTAPSNTVPGAPIRMAGNLVQFGNSFADLAGGMSSVASRMPILSQRADGSYSLSVRLPVGADFRYKYTLGDGFWNAEHNADGSFLTRQLIVPPSDTVINDHVYTWQAGDSSPILFQVTVPPTTPAGDIVSIQFNPYGWTEPLPMWALGNNTWAYKLYGPLNMLGTFGYRYCRNDQCGSADDLSTAGTNPLGRIVGTSLLEQYIQDTVSAWAWYAESDPVTLVATPVNPRTGFWAGMEFQSSYHPSWQGYAYPAMLNIQSLGSNWVVLTPTWKVLRADPLIFAPTPGSDPFWLDTLATVGQARALNLNVALFAQPRLATNASAWWASAPRSELWWNGWFDRYRAFALYHADLAAQSGSQALILGGEWTLPAMPNGTLADGSSSGVPADADARWQSLIGEVRQRFNGQVLWAVPYQGAVPQSPAFLSGVDAVYLLWSAPLASAGSNAADAMTAEAGRLLDGDIVPFLANVQKPVVIAVNYPSATGAAAGCIPSGPGGCLDPLVLNRPYEDMASASINLREQVDLYHAMLNAINDRAWIGGFISRGYYPPAALMDKSASIHGKMAADLLWYWYPRLTGAVK